MKKISLFAITLLVAAGCSEEEYEGTISEPHGSFLPGEYPVELAAGGLEIIVSPETRGTFDGNWDGAGIVAATDDGGETTKHYKVEASAGDGYVSANLVSDNPLWWNSGDEKKNIAACHPAPEDGQMVRTGDVWQISRSQSQETFAQEDFLWAARDGVAFSWQPVQLEFGHRLARIVVNIRKADGLSDLSVSLVNQPLEGVFRIDGSTCVIEDSGAGLSAIEPCRLSVPNRDIDFGDGVREEAFASFEALVIPHERTGGSPLISLSADGTDYVYSAGESVFEGGKIYTYNITLQKEAITGIAVTGNTWDEGELFGLATDDGAAAYRISDGRLVPDDPYNPLRWSSKTSPVSVTGWYAYGMTEEYAATRPETFTVQQDQSTAEGVRKSDFLYAEGSISYNGSKNLSFKHCLTKLRINVTYKDGASGTFTWKYPFIIEGQIGTGGTVTANTDGASAVVIPAKLSTPYGGYDETFEFMLPVQSLSGGKRLATFLPSGGGEANLPVPSAGVQLKPGVAMAIAVVISPLSISINGNIAWGEGSGGSGSVVLP